MAEFIHVEERLEVTIVTRGIVNRDGHVEINITFLRSVNELSS